MEAKQIRSIATSLSKLERYLVSVPSDMPDSSRFQMLCYCEFVRAQLWYLLGEDPKMFKWYWREEGLPVEEK